MRCLCGEGLGEGDNGVLEAGLELLAQGSLLIDGSEEIGLVGAEVVEEVRLPGENLVDWDVIEESVDTGEDEWNHLVDGHWGVLLLLEELGQLYVEISLCICLGGVPCLGSTYTLTTVKGLLGGSIQIGTELGEGGDLTVLSQKELQGTGDLLHGLQLGGGSDTGDGKTDVNRWADTLVEELGLQENLSIGNGNDVGWNVSGDITTLGLNNWEGSEGSTTVLVGHLGSTLEETRVEVEDISWVGLTSWWATEEQGHLTVGNGLLGQIVEDDDGVLAVVTEPLTHGGTGEGSNVLKWSGLGSGGGNDDGVLHGVVLLKGLDELGDGGTLLSDSDVHTVELLALVVSVVPTLLVKHGIEGNSGLSGLAITNDQLALTTSDRNHGINGLESGLDGLVDGVTWENTWSLKLGTTLLLGVEWSLSINWVSESINDTAEKLWSDWNIDLWCVSRGKGGIARMRPLTISPVRLTVSPSLTRRSEPKSTTPTWPASKFMHIPLTPDANLLQLSVLDRGCRENLNLLDELLSLDVVHAVNTGDTITNPMSANLVLLYRHPLCIAQGSTSRHRVWSALLTYPTDRTRPVSARPASSWTPRILCSRIEETSVGEALASA